MPLDRIESTQHTLTVSEEADAKMDAESLPKVQMPNRDGFYVDDRPDVQNTRCMTDCLKKSGS